MLGADLCTALLPQEQPPSNTDLALQPLVVTLQWWPMVSEALRHPVASLTLDSVTQHCQVARHSLHIQSVLCAWIPPAPLPVVLSASPPFFPLLHLVHSALFSSRNFP